MLGITFKENCPDIRNTKATDIVTELKAYGVNVDIYDPWANPEGVQHEYDFINKSINSVLHQYILQITNNILFILCSITKLYL